MNNFNTWQQSKIDLASAKSWLSNKSKIDSQDNKHYRLVVAKAHRELFQFCGQAYAGANNYHKMPECLLPFLSESLKKNFNLIINQAISDMEDSTTKSGLLAEDEVKAMLNEIKNSGVA